MTPAPQNLADRPTSAEADDRLDLAGQPYDLLSGLLRSVRLSGERIVAYAPHDTVSIAFADVGTVHLIQDGELAVRVDGNPHVEHVRAGNVVLLPRGARHHISTAAARERDATRPESTRWLCGTFTIGDPHASHLLASLPAVIILRGGGGQSLEGLEVARRMLLIEMQSPSQGSAVMIARILDVVFIQILRLWATGTDAEPNWLAGVLDPQIGPALSAIHEGPDQNWTVEKLARACSLSRSSFAERFNARVGTPPATYLAHVRLDAATDLLRDSSLAIALIAAKVGYSSEPAFSRAFKHRYGTPPARWRRDIRARHS